MPVPKSKYFCYNCQETHDAEAVEEANKKLQPEAEA